MKLKAVLAVSASLLLAASTAFAAEFIAPGQSTDSNAIVTGTHHNLYVAGGYTRVESNVTGDLTAAGGSVEILGDVEQNLEVAGGSISARGSVGRNAKIAGGSVTVENHIGGDLLIAAGRVLVTSKSLVGGDAALAGGLVTLDAPVVGNVKIAGGQVRINSPITGTVEVTSKNGFTFGPNAIVTGKIIYYGKSQPVIESGAKVSTIDQRPLRDSMRHTSWGLGTLLGFLMWLVALGIIFWLIPRGLNRTTALAFDRPWRNMGIGLLALILFPIVIVLLSLTFVGIFFAIMLAVWFTFICMVSTIIATSALGVGLMRLYKKDRMSVTWLTILIGVIAIHLLLFIPIIGWIAVLLLFLAALGTMMRTAYGIILANR
jgi:hypothetical protein